MAASRDGLFGHFPPWDNQGATGKGSLRPPRTFTLIKKTGNYRILNKGQVSAGVQQVGGNGMLERVRLDLSGIHFGCLGVFLDTAPEHGAEQ
jgi:hypothetical protein